MYLYELPTTGSISFSDFCVDQSDGKIYATRILEATQARANIRTALKASKRTEDGAKDFLSLTKVLGDYIPLIRALINCAAHNDIAFKLEPAFSWRSTLSNNLLNSPRVTVPGLYADLAFTLLTYAFTLSNLAHATVQSIGAYEHDRTITKVQRERKDEQLNVAFGFLCKASGVLSYIADTLLSEWETSKKAGSEASKLPPDLKQEVITALSKMALADAQSLAIRKNLSKAAFENNITPGPPLPSSHPPVSFIAKLHLECASLYGSSKTLAKATGGNTISSEVRKYLTDRNTFHTALSHKWLGIEAGEKGGVDRAGDAVAFLAWAKEELESLKDSNPTLHIVKGDKEKMKKNQLLDELEGTDTFYKYYKKMNDSLHFQPIPSQADLKSRIPAGLAAARVRPYNPPNLAFGPGSLEDVDRQTGALEIGDKPTEPRKGPSNYAGAGSYF